MATLLDLTSDGSVKIYYAWLRGLVAEPTPFHKEAMFTEAWNLFYVPTVPNDNNRANDGLDLRHRFTRETSIPLPFTDLGNCRMLEFLIALSVRLNDLDYIYTDPNRVSNWFWILIDNLGVRYADISKAHDVYVGLNLRDYGPDGVGGLFPLISPKRDQREVEVWYQMQEYLHQVRY